MPKVYSKKIKKVLKAVIKDFGQDIKEEKKHTNCQKEMQDVLCKLNNLNSSFPIEPLQSKYRI